MVIEGRPEYDASMIEIGSILDCERAIERVTGYRAHIEILEGRIEPALSNN